MKKIYDDGDEEFNRKLTREEKIQIYVRVIPIVLIVIILLITLLVRSVSNRRNQEGGSQADASVSTDVIAQETEETSNSVSTPIPSVAQGRQRAPLSQPQNQRPLLIKRLWNPERWIIVRSPSIRKNS